MCLALSSRSAGRIVADAAVSLEVRKDPYAALRFRIGTDSFLDWSSGRLPGANANDSGNDMPASNSVLDLTQWVRDVPDYPKPGILFRDLTPLMADPVPMRYVTDLLTRHLDDVGAEAVAAIDARGFIFAAPVAVKAGIPFIPLRKSGKLPPAVIGADYELEYGTARLEARHDDLLAGKRVVIVDDLLATGGTAAAAVQLLKNLDVIVASCAFVVELLPLNGRARFEDVDVFSLLTY